MPLHNDFIFLKNLTEYYREMWKKNNSINLLRLKCRFKIHMYCCNKLH